MLHIAICGGVAWLAQASASLPSVISAPSRTFIVFPNVVAVELRMPSTPLRVPRTQLADLPTPEPTLALPEVSPPARVEAHAAVEHPARELRVRPEPKVRPLSIEPQPRPVMIGAFANVSTVPQAPQTSREIRSAGFDSVTARAPELKVGPAKAGAFDAPAGVAAPRPGVDRPAQGVAVGGFGNASTGVASPTSPPGRVVADAGFGFAQGGSRAPAPPQTQVRTGGFDIQAAPTPTPKEAAPTPRVDTPVEVVFKPTPDYTEDARALKVEGDVLLEVQFTADSHVRVLRVVRGLGHGLDEAAIRAAERIRFKPALSAGRPIDFQTTVHIVFRLT